MVSYEETKSIAENLKYVDHRWQRIAAYQQRNKVLYTESINFALVMLRAGRKNGVLLL